MKLPHVPNRFERMWMEIKWIHRWNRLGGIQLYIDPAPWAIGQYPRLRREAERDIRRRHKEWIQQNRIGLRKAARMIRNAYKGWPESSEHNL